MSNSTSFVCFVCVHEFERQSLLTKHLLQSHPNRFDLSTANCKIVENHHWLCRFCHLPLKKYTIRKDHERRAHTKVLQYFCRHGCGAGFIDCTQRRNHEDEAHGELEYVCTVCGKAFKQYYAFTSHQKEHENAKFLCPENGCLKRCYTKKSLDKHLRKVHNPVAPNVPRQTNRAGGGQRRGQYISPVVHQQIVSTFLIFRKTMGATPACNATSRLFRVCGNTVWRAVQAAKNQKPMNNCKKQSRKSWKNLDNQTQTIIRQIVRENLPKKNVTLEALLQELMNVLPDFPYGRSTFAKIIRSMGFKFSKCKELQEACDEIPCSNDDSDVGSRSATSVHSNSNISGNESASASNYFGGFSVNLDFKCEPTDEAMQPCSSDQECSSAIEVQLKNEPDDVDLLNANFSSGISQSGKKFIPPKNLNSIAAANASNPAPNQLAARILTPYSCPANCAFTCFTKEELTAHFVSTHCRDRLGFQRFVNSCLAQTSSELNVQMESMGNDSETFTSSSLVGCSSAIEVEAKHEPAATDLTDELKISKEVQIRSNYRQILPRPASGSPSILPPSDQSPAYEYSAFNSANIVRYQQLPDGSFYPILKVPSNLVIPAVHGILMQTTMP